MKLLKSKGDNFKDIFTSLQRVVASFGSECAVDPSKFANSAEASRTKVNQDFDEILKSVGLEDMKTEEKESLMKAIETKTTPENVVITKENLQKVEKLFFEKNLDKSRTISNSVHDLGQNMSSLMSAIESGDESKMEEIFKSTGTSEMFKGVDMSQFKGEMEGEFEKEFNELEEDAEAVD
jgi:cytochrome c peroxidase